MGGSHVNDLVLLLNLLSLFHLFFCRFSAGPKKSFTPFTPNVKDHCDDKAHARSLLTPIFFTQ